MKNKINIIIRWIVRLIIVIAGIQCIINQDYHNTLILGITLLLTFYPFVLKKLFKLELPKTIEILVTFFIFAAQYLGTVKDWYGIFYWWDTMLHTISGALFAIIGTYILQEINVKTYQAKLHPLIIALFGLCFAFGIGVIWEIIEFLVDSYFGGNMQRAMGEIGRNAIMDTMVDLISASIGAVITSIVIYWKEKKQILKVSDKSK